MERKNSGSALPNTCYIAIRSTGELAILKNGVAGYYHSEWDAGSYEKNRALATQLNEKLGVTPAQQQAMEFGSLFGWDKPGANPMLYEKKDLSQQIAGAKARVDEVGNTTNLRAMEQTL